MRKDMWVQVAKSPRRYRGNVTIYTEKNLMIPDEILKHRGDVTSC